MATAKKLPSGKWRTLVYSHTETVLDKDGSSKKKRVYESFTADSKKESEYLAAQFRLKNDNRTKQVKQDYNNITFLEAVQKYCKLKSNILSPSTIRGYKQLERTAYESIKDCKLKELAPEIIQKWANDFSLKHSPKTVRNAHALLSAVLGVYAPSLIFSTSLPQQIKYHAYVPTDSEVETLIKHYSETDKDMYIASLLAAFGTLRRSEICALNADDVSGHTIQVRHAMVQNAQNEYQINDMTKNITSNRDVYLPAFIFKILPPKGRLMNLNPNQITQRHIKTLKKLEIPYFRFHDLRHYAASIMHALGIPDQYIMQRGGWSSDRILKEVYRGTIDDYDEKFKKVAFDHFEKMQHEMQHKKIEPSKHQALSKR